MTSLLLSQESPLVKLVKIILTRSSRFLTSSEPRLLSMDLSLNLLIMPMSFLDDLIQIFVDSLQMMELLIRRILLLLRSLSQNWVLISADVDDYSLVFLYMIPQALQMPWSLLR